jgi:predicted GNAT family N-acyltransferase
MPEPLPGPGGFRAERDPSKERMATRFQTIVVADDAGSLERWFPFALQIRRRVFVEEQHVPEALEVDGMDPVCRHVLAFERGSASPLGAGAVGTARLRPILATPGAVKVERVAVLPEWRGRGAGSLVMDTVESLAEALGFMQLVVSAQAPVIPWYRRRGYGPVGDRYREAGIEHQRMERCIRHQG